MLHLLHSVQSLFGRDFIKIDTVVFRVQYQLTVLLMIIGAVLVTSGAFFGDPIECSPINVDEVLESSADVYCHAHLRHTYTFTYDQNASTNENHKDTDTRRNTMWHHNYYHRVALILFLQAVLFLVPPISVVLLGRRIDGNTCRKTQKSRIDRK